VIKSPLHRLLLSFSQIKQQHMHNYCIVYVPVMYPLPSGTTNQSLSQPSLSYNYQTSATGGGVWRDGTYLPIGLELDIESCIQSLKKDVGVVGNSTKCESLITTNTMEADKENIDNNSANNTTTTCNNNMERKESRWKPYNPNNFKRRKLTSLSSYGKKTNIYKYYW
jgi:hypothetical protein